MEHIYVGRQPIYDRDLRVFAYEILYRGGPDRVPGDTDGNEATTQVLINTFLEIGLERLTDRHPAFFNLTREFFLDHELSLPTAAVVLEVLETIDIDPEFVEAVRRLAGKGYRIALDDFAFEDRWDPLLDIADFIKVDVRAVSADDLARQMPRLRGRKAKLLAEKVETHEEFEFLKALDFHYFQGYFFCKPRVIEGRKISSAQTTLFTMLAHLQKPEVSVPEIEKIIASDPSLGFKLLRYLNSAHFGLGRHRLQSLRQAIVFLGVRQLRSWVALLLVGGVKGKTSELARISMRRARQCEQLSIRCLDENDPESFFMAGLFSLLDALLDLPMDRILEELPVSEEIKQGIGQRSGRIGSVLDAVLAWEMGNPSRAEALPRRAGPVQMAEICLEAMLWADDQIKAIGSP